LSLNTTCYGKEFTDRLFGLRQRAASGEHDFDRLCADLGIAHRRSPPMHPQTNGKLKPECSRNGHTSLQDVTPGDAIR